MGEGRSGRGYEEWITNGPVETLGVMDLLRLEVRRPVKSLLQKSRLERRWVKVTQSCPTVCEPMDCIVHGIPRARILEWVAFPFSGDLPKGREPRDWTQPSQGLNPGLPHLRRILYQLSHQGSPRILQWVAFPFSRGFSNPGIELGSPALQAHSLPTELPGKP